MIDLDKIREGIRLREERINAELKAEAIKRKKLFSKIKKGGKVSFEKWEGMDFGNVKHTGIAMSFTPAKDKDSCDGWLVKAGNSSYFVTEYNMVLQQK